MKDEIIKEVQEEFKSRLNNPFIGSFLIALVIFNWQVPIYLIFYKQSELPLNHHSNYIEVILSNVSLEYNLYYPLASAGLYILFSPWVRRVIVWYMTKVSIGTNNMTTKQKQKLISFQNIIELKRLELENKVTQLEEKELQIERQQAEINQAQSHIDSLKTNVDSLTLDKNKLIEGNAINEQLNYEHILDGNWTVKLQPTSPEEVWKIRANDIYVGDTIRYKINSRIGYSIRLWLSITNLIENNRILLELNYEKGHDVVEGNDAYGNMVTMVVIPD